MFKDTAPIPDMHAIVGSHDIVFITLDTLRYDVAQAPVSYTHLTLPTSDLV